MNDTIQARLLDFIHPVVKERKGYADHFKSVYEPLIVNWLKNVAGKEFDPNGSIPLCAAVAEVAPVMLSAFPNQEIEAHRELLEGVVRLCELASESLRNGDDWNARYRHQTVKNQGNAYGEGMWLYRIGYSRASFTFYGGHDEGHIEDACIFKGGKKAHRDTAPYKEIAEDGGEIRNDFELTDWISEILPSGFGNDEPQYDNGTCEINLETMEFELETDITVSRRDSIERAGNLLSNGIDLDYYE